MKRLKKVTFTGVDEYTDVNRLVELQERYPYAEFGVLVSRNWAENGNRYPDPSSLERLQGRGLHLSLHLCGRVARESFKGNWGELTDLVWNEGATCMFDRIQLNLAAQNVDGKIKINGCPFDVDQFIIQQRSPDDCPLYRENEDNPMTSMLCDMSGGRGVFSETFALYNGLQGKMIGYAGGLDDSNVIRRLNQIEAENPANWYWIDMESSLRRNDEDRFDLDTVERILKKIDKWMKS